MRWRGRRWKRTVDVRGSVDVSNARGGRRCCGQAKEWVWSGGGCGGGGDACERGVFKTTGRARNERFDRWLRAL